MGDARASKELVIVGTGSGISLLQALGKIFMKQNPDITITVPASIGSGGGIRSVGNDEYVLGRVARDIDENEKQYNLEVIPIAKIPIVFYVNASISIWEISYEQACGIYSGAIRKWEEIGGGQGTIRVIRREDGDSSLSIFMKTLPGFKEITITERSKIIYTDQETVEACKSQKNAIAFGSLADIKYEKGVRALKLDGVDPTEPMYPHLGFLSLIYKQKNYKGNVKKFIEFTLSDDAKHAIFTAGGLPVK
jgi:phosphate transport system substrate-binding protein